nr:uncharacterized protein LOC129281415 [Lytechinus pictus]
MIGVCHAVQGIDELYSLVELHRISKYLPNGILVGKAVVTAKYGLVPIRVVNHSPRHIILNRSTQLAVLHATSKDAVVGGNQVDLHLEQVDAETLQVSISGESSLPDILQDIDISTGDLTEAQVNKTRQLLGRHRQVFSLNDATMDAPTSLPTLFLLGMLTPTRNLIKESLLSCIRRQHVENKVIRESSSPWASPIVLVKKRDGSIRLCVDYRKLNAKTRRDAFPLPRIDESLDALGGAKYFSTLDLASGYWQLKMEDQDGEKTAFTTPKGIFEFDRMPFGLIKKV